MNRRRITSIPTIEKNLLDTLKKNGETQGSEYWNDLKDTDLKKFKKQTKDHYSSAQMRRCCYCSIELQNNNKTKDLEHIVNKNSHPEFMFELRNLAVSCTFCNGTKGPKTILRSPIHSSKLPFKKEEYLHIHPHLDEWSEHLYFDEFQRILSKKTPKGDKTFEVCNFTKLNYTRLTDYFDNRKDAERSLRLYYNPENSKKTKEKHLNLLKEIAIELGSEKAQQIVRLIENDTH